jgi:hypothetical protein
VKVPRSIHVDAQTALGLAQALANEAGTSVLVRCLADGTDRGVRGDPCDELALAPQVDDVVAVTRVGEQVVAALLLAHEAARGHGSRWRVSNVTGAVTVGALRRANVTGVTVGALREFVCL